MSPEKRIGKIKSISFGRGGYQDAMIGICFGLGSESESWGVHDFWGTWSMKRTDGCQWTEADRTRQLGEMVMKINALLSDAKQHDIADLVGVPIEVTFEARTLKSWRVLTEAI